MPVPGCAVLGPLPGLNLPALPHTQNMTLSMNSTEVLRSRQDLQAGQEGPGQAGGNHADCALVDLEGRITVDRAFRPEQVLQHPLQGYDPTRQGAGYLGGRSQGVGRLNDHILKSGIWTFWRRVCLRIKRWLRSSSASYWGAQTFDPHRENEN